ncbi:fatty acid desaturase [Ralstonia sp. SET104]|uniref:fatty acid desaturase n=1 Tax=Ralstonia sp. SET104 TaxID=2448774 RepID=UPI000F57D99C|nr:fatty acid desaturase [Ralstonia sp. SET104]
MQQRRQLEISTEIRASYQRLPFQRFWTWLTGKALPGESPARLVHPVEPVIWSLIWFLGGVLASIFVLLSKASVLWLLLSMVFTVAGARYVVATIIHHGVHLAVFRGERANRILCEVLSTLTIVQAFDSYRQFHVHEHHGRDFSTMGDQDLAAIYTLGLRPGVAVARMRLILAWQCISPVFHLRYLWGRLKANFIGVPAYRLVMSCVWAACLCWLASLIGWGVLAIAVLLPLTVLYQICSLLHLVTEHAWVLRETGETVRSSHVNNSHGRFCGSPTPANTLHGVRWMRAWVYWGLVHLLVHLPARLLVVQGSLIVHDWHHRAGADRGWPNAIQSREQMIQIEMARGLYTYRDIWGIHHVIEEVLRRISEAQVIEVTDELRYRLN